MHITTALGSFLEILYARLWYILGAISWYRLITEIVETYRFRRFKAENGCGEPVLRKNKLPWALDVLFWVFRFKGDILDHFICQRFKEMGDTYLVYGLNGYNVNTQEPRNIQAILATKFNDFELGDVRSGNFAPLLGHHGIFTSNGKDWEHSRSMMRPQFSREQISHLKDLEKHLASFLLAVPADPAPGWTDEVDVMELFYRFTVDTSTEFLFGESVNSQLEGVTRKNMGVMADEEKTGRVPDASSRTFLSGGAVEEEMGFSDAFTFAQDFCTWRFRLAQFYWVYSTKKFTNACAVVHRFSDHFVDIALHPAKRTVKSDPSKFVLLEALSQETQDPQFLRDQLLNVLLAGRDTTAGLLSWVFYLLPRHPEVFAKLRAEVSATFGADASDESLMTFERLKSMKYMRHVLNETLRLFPIVPLNVRVAVRDTVLPSGGGPDGNSPIAIKKGWPVSYSVYGMHRRADIWGADVLEFKPERWEGRKVGWEFLPFNGGPRICLGQQYALSEASFVIVRLLQHFSVMEHTDETGTIETAPKSLSITITPKNGVKLRMKKANAGPRD